MTYDDGILVIYQRINIAEAGDMPQYRLQERSRHFYHMDALGYQRYYVALQSSQTLTFVADIPDWHTVLVDDICVLNGDIKCRVALVQFLYDDNNLKMTKLSLERVGGNDVF